MWGVWGAVGGEEGEGQCHKRQRRKERQFCAPEVDRGKGWEGTWHRAAASSDYLSDFHSHIN